MKFGLDKTTNERIEPQPGLLSNCPCCGTELLSKCGDIRVHHWAHRKGPSCDHWWEPETEWHRKWKNKFPTEWQETIKFDRETGEKHIADIFNPDIDLVIEFQNSPIDVKEMKSREKFYKRMVWVVNAEKFDFATSSLDEWNEDVERLEKKFRRDAFKSHKRPAYELVEKNFDHELELRRINKELAYGKLTIEEAKFRKWKVETEMRKNMVDFYADGENEAAVSLKKYIEELDKYRKENETKEIDDFFIQYTWSYRKKVWDEATLPVFFDLGNEVVLIKSQFIAKRVQLDKFFKKYGGKSATVHNTVHVP